MKKLIIAAIGMMLATNLNAAKKPTANALQFDPNSGVKASLTMPDGKVVNYTAYTKLYFVTNIEDPHLPVHEHLCTRRCDPANAYLPPHLRGGLPTQPGR